MVRMTKGLQIIEKFANRRSALSKAYTGEVSELTLPRGFVYDHAIRIEKESKPLILVTLNREQFHISKLGSSEIADAYMIELRDELKLGGLKEI